MDKYDYIPRYIKTSLKAFRYDDVVTTWGWPHDIHFDRENEKFVMRDFPKKGLYVEFDGLPEFGHQEVVHVGMGKKFRIRVYE